jgi:hypothetical protein
MQCYRELRITSHTLDENEIIRFVGNFAKSTPGWSYPEKKSREYAAICGVPSCCVIHEPTTFPKAAIHLTLYKPKRMKNGLYAPNIIPLDRSCMTLSEYNRIAQRFARELRLRARNENISGLRELVWVNPTQITALGADT